MKKLFTTFLPVLLLFSCVFAQREGHEIEIKVDGIKNAQCYLAHHFGDRKFIKDTVEVNENGVAVLKGKDKIPGGVYLFVLPQKKKFFEFLITKDQHFTLTTKKNSLVKSMEINGSEDNEVFFDYIRYLNKHQRKVQKKQKRYKQLKNKNQEKAEQLKSEIQDISEKINQKKEEVIKDHSETFYAYVLKTMKKPEYPTIKKDNGKVDSMKSFMAYKRRFLNSVDWSDERLLRSPVYHDKLTTYLEDLTAKAPDSIIRSADQIVSRTDTSNKTFKYVVNHITTKYEKSDIMGMDKVFVHMAEQYYLTGMADWVSDKHLKKIRKRVKRIRPNLIGKKAPRLTMENTKGSPVALYDINKPVTVLFFWDSDCGHCQEAIPKLKNIYNKYHEKGMEVFAVNIENKKKSWLEYLKENDLPWINVQDRYNRSRFRSYYDIYSTPVIYVLDENKEIRAKRISTKQLKDIVPKLLKEMENSKDNDSGKG